MTENRRQNQKERDEFGDFFRWRILSVWGCQHMCVHAGAHVCTCRCTCVLAPGQLMTNSSLHYPQICLLSSSLVASGFLVNGVPRPGDKPHLRAKLGASLLQGKSDNDLL